MSEPIKMEPVSLPFDPWIVFREGREQAWGILIDVLSSMPLASRILIIVVLILGAVSALRRRNVLGIWRAWRRIGWFRPEY
jgi:hypothetical protein